MVDILDHIYNGKLVSALSDYEDLILTYNHSLCFRYPHNPIIITKSYPGFIVDTTVLNRKYDLFTDSSSFVFLPTGFDKLGGLSLNLVASLDKVTSDDKEHIDMLKIVVS
jgi:hypothetical protein